MIAAAINKMLQLSFCTKFLKDILEVFANLTGAACTGFAGDHCE